MTESELEPVMLSALQHYLFCPRQFALIHIEGLWRENYLTSTGRQLHKRVDRKVNETRRDVHIATALRLVSRRLGIVGVADMVEFHRIEDGAGVDARKVAAPIAGMNGLWTPFPVEYKRGRPKPHHADEVQLCAQALCLEEMLDVSIPMGALYYGEVRRRMEVRFDAELRLLTEKTVLEVRALIDGGITPPVSRTEGCEACSMSEACVTSGASSSASQWILRQIVDMPR